MYGAMALLVRDKGGTIVPMFNDFVDATTKQVRGHVHDVGNEMSNGLVASRVRLEA